MVCNPCVILVKNWFDKLKTKTADDKFKELNNFFQITKNDTPLKFSITAATKFLDPNTPIEYSLKGEISKEELKEVNYLENLMRIMDGFTKNLNDYITSDKLYLFIDDLDSTWDNSEFAKLYTEGLIQGY